MGLRENTTIPKLGEFLRDRRKREGLSLRAAASRLDVNFSYLADIERGGRDPSEELLQKLAKLYEVDIADLEKLDARIPINELRGHIKESPKLGIELKRLLADLKAGTLRPEKLAQALSKVQ